MDMAVKNDKLSSMEMDAVDTLFSLLDKGIDDVEAGNEYTFEDAFKMLEEA